MTRPRAVPADVDADSISVLVEDCREISIVLGAVAPCPTRPVTAPGSGIIDISAAVAARLEGYGAYGS